jgi:hypothetical protein
MMAMSLTLSENYHLRKQNRAAWEALVGGSLVEVGSAVFLFLETARTLASRLQKKVDRDSTGQQTICVWWLRTISKPQKRRD